MKRAVSISAALVLTYASLASAQSSASRPLADVAKAEEARRKGREQAGESHYQQRLEA